MKTEELKARLKEVLHFSTFTEAETSLRVIHALYEDCRATRDGEGMTLCRQRILDAKKRALLIARNPKVAPRKRDQKKEMHLWFSLWLENADTFFVWLDLRKNTRAFQELSKSEESNA
ncbi:MAG: hypothetical protein JXQ27_11600 [Acidobacteria bacterium]|nr:hypothetical protein [Acidobacteriota bacterium]